MSATGLISALKGLIPEKNLDELAKLGNLKNRPAIAADKSNNQVSSTVPQLPAKDLKIYNNNPSHFTDGAQYVADYDLGVNQLTGYKELMRRHSAAMPKGKVKIIDAGGGTGNISKALMESNPSADVHLMDLNPGMTKYAINKGIQSDHIHTSSITDMKFNTGQKVPEKSIDGITVNNVLYILTNDQVEEAFAEFSRVIKPNGKLSISGPKVFKPGDKEKVLDYFNKDLQAAVERRDIPSDLPGRFYEANRQLTIGFNSPMDNQTLIDIASQHGFRVVENSSAYSGFNHFVVFEKIPSP